MSQFSVTFLGVRGTVPCCEKKYQEYGGHTSCILMEIDDHVLLFDAGSGIATANQYIKNKAQKNIHLFFSHVHLDYILGLPACEALWSEQKNFHIYAGTLEPYGGIQCFLEKTFSAPLFPIDFKNFPANITYLDFNAGDSIQLSDGIKIDTCALNHPNGAIGYRVNYNHKSACYITDTEHKIGEIDHTISTLIYNTDLFIYDSTFTDDSYKSHKGWGHSTWQEGCRLSQASNVKSTAIFHHDPAHDDKAMQAIEKQISHMGGDVFIARQGQQINL